MKESLAGMTLDEISSLLTNKYDQPAYRAKQLYSWVYRGMDFPEMTNLPLKLRETLQKSYNSCALVQKNLLMEEKSGTKKFLLRTFDDIIIETVLLEYEHGDTVCVSTQAGCGMGCKFCSSGKNGLMRSLSAGEMISQILCIMRYTGREVSNIVLMGSGEPLNNYDSVKKFILLANDEAATNISMRKITLSTCGVIPGIRRLIEDELFVNLSISLHSPLHEMRAEMMPAERKYPIKDVVSACEDYRRASKRRITYEYCVIEGKNDTDECARALKDLVGGSDALINLIDVNSGSGVYADNSDKCAYRFMGKLTRLGLSATLRRKLGSSINAACGQLKSHYEREMQENS